MLVLTNAQMREADKFTIESKGVPALTLMERAGIALAQAGEKLAPSGKILCVCGGGNNGGDGFVCARLLKEKGREVAVVCFAEKYSEQCAVNLQKWKDMGGTIEKSIPETSYDLVIDCLFGTGFHGVLEGESKSAVLEINCLKQQGARVLSADIPSGVNGKNGRVNGIAVCADETLCIGEIKTGVFLNDGMDYFSPLLFVVDKLTLVLRTDIEQTAVACYTLFVVVFVILNNVTDAHFNKFNLHGLLQWLFWF